MKRERHPDRPGKTATGESRTTPIAPGHIEGATLSLLVLGEDLMISHALPADGRVSIGRASQNVISIENPSLSRRHAVLHLGEQLFIEDVGSANGTVVRGQRVEARTQVSISPNEVVTIGAVSILVQRRTRPLKPRNIWTHGYFEGRLEEECARAERFGSSFALARIRCVDGTSPALVQQALCDILRTVDVLGTYSPDEFEVLLVDAAPVVAEQITARLREHLFAQDATVTLGVACYPHDGRDAHTLIAHASATPGGEPSSRTVVAASAMKRVYDLVERVAKGNISVLIQGETGVGKEVVAEALHRASRRADRSFLQLSCAALPESLLESELFGHERGAFTGALRAKPGLLETADGGTIFLDEIGELPLTIQAKLLRVIEQRQVLRIGDLNPRDIDVRFVSATNRDLEAEIARGHFRQDLYFRLNGVSVFVPPLRERTDEIPGLVTAFIAHACKDEGRAQPPTISASSMDLLLAYSWPGNVRELRNVIERAVLLCNGPLILPEHLPTEKMAASTPATPARPTPATAGATNSDLRHDKVAFERARIIDAIEKCNGNQTEAARILGISRRTIVKKIQQLKVPRPRKGH